VLVAIEPDPERGPRRRSPACRWIRVCQLALATISATTALLSNLGDRQYLVGHDGRPPAERFAGWDQVNEHAGATPSLAPH
jgi:hypothetical protein